MKMITADKLSNAEYHAKTEYISSSAVKEVHGKSLAHWQARQSFKSTPAMAIGTAVHDIVLEGGNGIVRHNGPDRRGKQWSEPFAEAEANDKLLMTAADYDLAIAVAGSVLDHPVGRKMEGKDTINDIKTCQDSSPSAVQADIRKYSYPIQAAFYLHTLRCAGFKAERFIFVFVEKTTPYAVNVTELTLGYIAWADSAMHKALSDIKQARETNVYDTGFSTGINMVDIPHWLNQEIANNDDF